jgi:peptidoglycan/xylan/chitin deacetylase (PgdA/CDA1 family)
METRANRRDLLKAAIGLAAGVASWSFGRAEDAGAEQPRAKEDLFLLRYDTERGNPEVMKGFLEKVLEVHRSHQIPATLFCTGSALKRRETQFRSFHEEVKEDALFDIQDHSYSHVGLGYERGEPIPVLKADYERSFAVHERLFGVRPIGIAMCGTGGKNGNGLSGFDATEKSRAELEMVASLGVRMINSFLTRVQRSKSFIHYGSLGHPEIMGFPYGYSDTVWMDRREHGAPLEYILGEIRKRARKHQTMPLMLHDWVTWTRAPDRELTHVKRIADAARKAGYRLVTHVDCLRNKDLWA